MKTELTLDAVKDALAFIPADDRDLWVKIAMSLKDEFGDTAKDAWLDWSSSAAAYDATAAGHVWKSVKAGKITIGTLIYEAKQFGWRPQPRHQRKVTPEEYARKQAERDRRRQAEEAEAAERAARAAARAVNIWESAEPATSHPYLTRKGIQPNGARLLKVWERKAPDPNTGEMVTVSVLNALLVPLYSGPRTIASLQAIFPAPNEFLDRDKDYLPGGHKQGCYFTLGEVTRATLRIILCEGFATGCSIHEATGSPVFVCFDAGNLPVVARMVRDKLPDVEIIVAGDNDLWTKGNPGARKANAAAWDVKGRVALPVFDDYADNPTDFNDLRDHAEILAQIEQSISPVDPDHYEPQTRWTPPPAVEPQPAVGSQSCGENSGSGPSDLSGCETAAHEPPSDQGAAPTAPPDGEGDDDDVLDGGSFRILGYDHDRYYVFQHERKQLAVFTGGSFTDSGFISLAPLQWWEINFPADAGFNKRAAMNWFIRTAHSRGIFDPSHTRGRGAWVDRGRIVLHIGNRLIVDGAPTEITDFDSRYVYELDRSLPALSTEPLTSDEGEEILATAMMFRWTKPASAPMLAGWCALAPLCGALRWRPHIWLTGGAGCGKSTLLNEFVYPLMNGMSIFAQGNSTEAGVRQKLRKDALPVLFDESEKNNERERQRVDGVLALIRQASTESAAQTLKGSANGESMAFHIRSMFCLASIQVGMEHQADYERLAVLALRAKRDDEVAAARNWETIKERLYALKRDELLPARLFRRSLNLLPVTLKNIEVFASAAAEKFGSQRDGDQYGTLMAGAWSLISDRVATPEEARDYLDLYEWSDFMDHADSDDSIKALSAVMGAHVRMPAGLTVTIHELLLLARCHVVDGVDGISASSAEAMLGRYGIKIEGSEVLFANSCTALHGLISHTPYAADLKGQLMRVKGARRFDRPIYVSGITSRAVAIPLDPLVNSIKNFEPKHDDRPF